MSKENFWWSPDRMLAANMPFNIIIGGRGIGKTYSTLDYAYNDNLDGVFGRRMVYMRRTDSEISSSMTLEESPFKRLNLDKQWNIGVEYSTKLGFGRIYEKIDDDTTNLLGYGCALSTFGKLRGVDLSDCDKIVYDEFSPLEGSCRPIKNEADLLFNAYETVNRNREVMGQDPVKLIMLTNATDLAAPIFVELNLVKVLESLIQDDKKVYIDRERGLYIEMPKGLGITEKKKQTALYKLTKGSVYFNHAIGNDFSYQSTENVGNKSLAGFRAYMIVDNYIIFQHNIRLEFYVSEIKNGKKYVVEQTFTGDSVPLFRRYFGIRFVQLMLAGYVYWDSFKTKNFFYDLFQIA